MTDDLLVVSRRLRDDELTLRVRQLACAESRLTALLVAHLAEFDDRRLFLGEGYSSLFVYCTEALHLSEQSTLNRIVAARLARQFPEVLKRLEEQSIHLSGLRTLSPLMTEENHLRLLDLARHQSKRRIEQLVEGESEVEEARESSAITQPGPAPMIGGLFDVSESSPDSVAAVAPGECALPERVGPPGQNDRHDALAGPEPQTPPTTLPKPVDLRRSHRSHRTRATRVSPGLIRLQVTLDTETHTLLLQARELLLHRLPQGDLSQVIHHALDRLVRDLCRRKFGGKPGRRRKRESGDPQTRLDDSVDTTEDNPGSSSRRYIPTHIRRGVWTRDEGRCAFIGTDGHRCGERGRLEFHHVIAFARGGAATVENIQLRCRAHNQFEAEREFGTTGRSESQDARRP